MYRNIQKKVTSFWERYSKLFGWGFMGVTLFMAFIGSYQYYTDYVPTVVQERLYSTVIYSTLQLYLFSPTVDAGEATPILYEAAKWTAPLCTAYWIFKLLESFALHSIGIVKQHSSPKRQIMIFGYNENSKELIENIYLQNQNNAIAADDTMMVLITEQTIEKEEQLKLERKGVLVYQMDFSDDENFKTRENFRCLKLWKASEIVLFYEDAAVNFTIFTRLLKLIHDSKDRHWEERKEKKEEIICAFQCNDRVLRKVVEAYDANPRAIVKEKVEDIRLENPFDLRLFSLQDLAAEAMFAQTPLFQNCIPSEEEWHTIGNRQEEKQEAEAFLRRVKNPHLLIVGFGRYGKAVFEKALLMGTCSPCSAVRGYEKFRITVVDQNAEKWKEEMYDRYPRLDRICDVEFVQLDVRSRKLMQALSQISMFTYAAVCFKEQTLSILTMMELAKYTSMCLGKNSHTSIPIAVRMETDGAIVQYMQKMPFELNKKTERLVSYNDIHVFGTRKNILTRECLINTQMEQKARKFHVIYEREAANLYEYKDYGNEIPAWNTLDFEKKESNRVQVLNQSLFQTLIERLGPLPEKEKVLISSSSVEQIREVLNRYPVLDLLAQLEHKRWNAFAYTYGYIGYGKPKRTFQKIQEKDRMYYGEVHDCLIDSWEEMKQDDEAAATILFDVCSLYGYQEQENVI